MQPTRPGQSIVLRMGECATLSLDSYAGNDSTCTFYLRPAVALPLVPGDLDSVSKVRSFVPFFGGYAMIILNTIFKAGL
jgi:hypothetical protein